MKTYIPLIFILISCSVTSHQTKPKTGLEVMNESKLIQALNTKPIIKFDKIISADWEVARSGLINLKSEKAISSNLKDAPEPIQIYLYSIEHPKFGKFFIDSGVSEVFKKSPNEWPISGMVQSAMNTSKLKIHKTTKELNTSDKSKLNGVFLTHLHLDHILGIYDLPEQTEIFIGKNETSGKRFINLFVQGTTDRLLGNNPNIKEIEFKENNADEFQVIDYFGDSSFFILKTNGHTKGSISFLVNSTTGKQLITGDTCHTTWGWLNEVEPGEFTEDQEQNKKSLLYLKRLSEKIKDIKIHLGHQNL
jgi:glyoxylase-like metal-dependent hydrolase (beta-lactamase superfamily II)